MDQYASCDVPMALLNSVLFVDPESNSLPQSDTPSSLSPTLQLNQTTSIQKREEENEIKVQETSADPSEASTQTSSIVADMDDRPSFNLKTWFGEVFDQLTDSTKAQGTGVLQVVAEGLEHFRDSQLSPLVLKCEAGLQEALGLNFAFVKAIAKLKAALKSWLLDRKCQKVPSSQESVSPPDLADIIREDVKDPLTSLSQGLKVTTLIVAIWKALEEKGIRKDFDPESSDSHVVSAIVLQVVQAHLVSEGLVTEAEFSEFLENYESSSTCVLFHSRDYLEVEISDESEPVPSSTTEKSDDIETKRTLDLLFELCQRLNEEYQSVMRAYTQLAGTTGILRTDPELISLENRMKTIQQRIDSNYAWIQELLQDEDFNKDLESMNLSFV